MKYIELGGIQEAKEELIDDQVDHISSQILVDSKRLFREVSIEAKRLQRIGEGMGEPVELSEGVQQELDSISAS